MSHEIEEFQVLNSMKVPDDFKVNGFIYVLSNESMPGVYKIGMTRNSPDARAKEISTSTGVPQPFKVVAAFHSKNPAKDEKIIHEAWSKERVSPNREFFKLSDRELSHSLDEIRTIVGPERDGDVAEYAIYDTFISFCDDPELDLDEELIELGLGGMMGHIPAIKNFLIRSGLEYTKRLISQYNSSIVINTDGSISLVKSLETQHYEREGQNELS